VRPARFPLAALPTPLLPALRLREAVGSGPILIKRDDLAGFVAAGNKARTLEYLIGEATARGCDVVVTGGGPGSNFCAAAAAAAKLAKLECQLVLYGRAPARLHPNLASALAWGAKVRFSGRPDREEVDLLIGAAAAELEAEGRRAMAIPRGGATAVGAAGFALAAHELAQQLDDFRVQPAAIVVATGSGGTQAGLLAGSTAQDPPWRVIGASVSRPPAEASAQVLRLAQACASLLGLTNVEPVRVEVVNAVGPGFAVPSKDGEAAARLLFETEGLLLDPVYTAKAFAEVLRLIDGGMTGPIVFWHTGGLVAALHHLVEGV
jgi:1-aminocyclopropane-1-carboxylate deaminase/D-cysteine desulfhydrase-like pyridoxal-dependent ACC family enzyme